MKTHHFNTSGTAYDECQTNEDIEDGDVLVCIKDQVVGFLLGAWPVAVTAEHGKFHALLPDDPKVPPGLKTDSLVKAIEIAEAGRLILDYAANNLMARLTSSVDSTGEPLAKAEQRAPNKLPVYVFQVGEGWWWVARSPKDDTGQWGPYTSETKAKAGARRHLQRENATIEWRLRQPDPRTTEAT